MASLNHSQKMIIRNYLGELNRIQDTIDLKSKQISFLLKDKDVDNAVSAVDDAIADLILSIEEIREE